VSWVGSWLLRLASRVVVAGVVLVDERSFLSHE
jgi:hypothetical protein